MNEYDAGAAAPFDDGLDNPFDADGPMVSVARRLPRTGTWVLARARAEDAPGVWIGLARWELGAQLDTMRWSGGLGVTLLPDVQVTHWVSVNGLEDVARALSANDRGSD